MKKSVKSLAEIQAEIAEDIAAYEAFQIQHGINMAALIDLREKSKKMKQSGVISGETPDFTAAQKTMETAVSKLSEEQLNEAIALCKRLSDNIAKSVASGKTEHSGKLTQLAQLNTELLKAQSKFLKAQSKKDDLNAIVEGTEKALTDYEKTKSKWSMAGLPGFKVAKQEHDEKEQLRVTIKDQIKTLRTGTNEDQTQLLKDLQDNITKLNRLTNRFDASSVVQTLEKYTQPKEKEAHNLKQK